MMGDMEGLILASRFCQEGYGFSVGESLLAVIASTLQMLYKNFALGQQGTQPPDDTSYKVTAAESPIIAGSCGRPVQAVRSPPPSTVRTVSCTILCS